MADEFRFIPPPEAPIFEPSIEEFSDPLTYIAKIRPIAEKSGICKIRPPKGWCPPFSVDNNKFKFTPRLQKLNELEAQTRIRLNFHDQLGRFWELQGIKLRIPNVDRKLLDLYKLNKSVLSEGGFDAVCNQKKWGNIAKMLDLGAGNHSVGSTLRNHYEKTLLPFDLFISGASFQHLKSSFMKKGKLAKSVASKNANENSNSRMLKANLGPPNLKKSPKKGKTGKIKRIDQYICLVCQGGDHEEKMLLCDGCDDPYHIFCLTPKLSDVPMGDWMCPRCLASIYYRPPVDFGFQQSNRDYTLDSFGEMADQFKAQFFNKPVSSIPRETVEQNFWQLVGSLRGNVWVEYGADLSANEVGSGFPTRKNTKVSNESTEKYITSGWNLNNLPVNKKSVLRHIDVDISGMKIPWCYVGMCFSSFCWHIEDHWSYSINYLHRGEPKTWYGVGSCEAELFEQVMRDQAPELFEQSPDLLHHITTIMNPNTLMDKGVNICRTDQQAGEFVVTFPRAYHAGFNQGFNFAEAVNFCPVDWLTSGRKCIEHYADMHRRCVFSHDELVCLMAAKADDLDPSFLEGIQTEIERIHTEERMRRKGVLRNGIRRTDRVTFEDLPDDDRQCALCSTTIFLSALVCPCCTGKLVCLSHTTAVCHCSIENKILHYRHTLDELSDLVRNIKIKLDNFQTWNKRVTEIVKHPQLNEKDNKLFEKPSLTDLQELITNGEQKNYSEETVFELNNVLNDVRRCSRLCQDLFRSDSRRRKTRGHDYSLEVKKLTLAEFHDFSQVVRALPCEIDEQSQLDELDARILKWTGEVEALLGDDHEEPDSERLKELLQFAEDLDVVLPQCNDLQHLLERVEWLEDVKNRLTKPEELSLSDLTALLESGCLLSQDDRIVETCNRLKRILNAGENIEAKALSILKAKQGQFAIFAVQSVISEASVIEAYLPQVEKLEDIMDEAKQVTKELEEIKHLMQQKICPIRETVVNLLERSQKLPVSFPGIKELQSSLSYLENWREHAASLFLKKNSSHSLLEVLLPRSSSAINQLADNPGGTPNIKQEAGVVSKRSRKTTAVNKLAQLSANRENCQRYEQKWKEQSPMAEKVCSDVYRQMEREEMNAVTRLRHANTKKSDGVDQDDVTYCHCHRAGLKGIMVQCELCKDWFHDQCVTMPKRESLREAKFLCPQCERSLRPSLSIAVFELMRKICFDVTIRFPEVDALQLLTNRALTFQQRIHRLISRDKELRRAFSDYSRIMGVRVTAPGEQWSKPALDARSKDSNDANHCFSRKQSRKSPHNPRGIVPGSDSQAFPGHPSHQKMPKHSHEPGHSPGSSLSGREDNSTTSGGKDVSKKLASVHFELSEPLRADLVLLIMEGDLLEVTIPETTWLWHLYWCSAPHTTSKPTPRDKRHPRGRSDIKEAIFPHSRSRSRSSHVSSIDNKSFASHTKGSSINQLCRGDSSKLFRRQHARSHSPFSGSSSTSSDGSDMSDGDMSDSINSVSERGHHHHTHHQAESDSDDSDLSSNSKNSSFCMDTTSLPSSKPPMKRPVVSTAASKKRSKAGNSSWTMGSDKNTPSTQPRKPFTKMSVPATNNQKVTTLRKDKKTPAPTTNHANKKSVVATVNKLKSRDSVAPAAPPRKRTRVCNDDCHAEVCCQPTGNKVNWVMCDKCTYWYHWGCVGIKCDDQIVDDYMCPQCLSARDGVKVDDEDTPEVKKESQENKEEKIESSEVICENVTVNSDDEALHSEEESQSIVVEEIVCFNQEEDENAPTTTRGPSPKPEKTSRPAPVTESEPVDETDYGEPPVLEQQEEEENEDRAPTLTKTDSVTDSTTLSVSGLVPDS